jgi:hypothetical protein
MDFSIHPYIGVGPIKFGMCRKEVRETLDSYTRDQENVALGNGTDHFEQLGLMISYSNSDECEVIEFTSPSKPHINGINLIGLPYKAALKKLHSLNASIIEDKGCIISFQYGISLWSPDRTHNGPVKSLCVFRKGYYDGLELEPGDTGRKNVAENESCLYFAISPLDDGNMSLGFQLACTLNEQGHNLDDFSFDEFELIYTGWSTNTYHLFAASNDGEILSNFLNSVQEQFEHIVSTRFETDIEEIDFEEDEDFEGDFEELLAYIDSKVENISKFDLFYKVVFPS